MLSVDPDAPEPAYRQLVDAVIADVESGELAVGARLPAVRRLAEDLGLAPGTVARAYAELESRGIVSTHGRRGTLVSAAPDARRAHAREAASAYVDRVVGGLGLTADDARELIAQELTARERR